MIDWFLVTVFISSTSTLEGQLQHRQGSTHHHRRDIPLVKDRVPETQILGLKSKLKKAFLQFLPYLMMFQSGVRVCKTVKKIIKKYAQKNLAKNEEKSCSTCIDPIFWLILDVQCVTTTHRLRSSLSQYRL